MIDLDLIKVWMSGGQKITQRVMRSSYALGKFNMTTLILFNLRRICLIRLLPSTNFVVTIIFMKMKNEFGGSLTFGILRKGFNFATNHVCAIHFLLRRSFTWRPHNPALTWKVGRKESYSQPFREMKRNDWTINCHSKASVVHKMFFTALLVPNAVLVCLPALMSANLN